MFSREFIFIYGILYSSSEQPGGIASCTTMTVVCLIPLYLFISLRFSRTFMSVVTLQINTNSGYPNCQMINT